MIKANKIVQEKQINSLDKYYNVAKILLALAPFVSLLYLSMESTRSGVILSNLIANDPRFAIMFLVSMINPFIAYLLMFSQKKMREDDVEYTITNLVMFIITEVMLMNVWYVILFSVILYKTLKTYNKTIKDSFNKKMRDGILIGISGSLVVIVLAGICLFATIRINM